MRIVTDGYIYQTQPRGGISRVFSELLPRMCAADPDAHITIFTVGHVAARPPSADRLTWVRVPDARRFLRPGRLFNRSVTPYVQDVLNRWWTGAHNQPVIWHPTYYVLPRNSARLSCVITVHDMIHELFPNFLRSAEDDEWRARKRYCIERADALICISHTTANDLRALYPGVASKIRVIPSGYAAPKQVNDAAASEKDKPFFLYVGQRGGYKNFELVLRAFAVWRHREQVSLYVVGPPLEPHEKAWVEELKVTRHVVCLNSVPDDALGELYRRAAAFVYPSLYEGFGLPLLEAIAAGCPVIASRIPSTIEVAGEYPIYFEPTSVEDAQRAFSAVLEGERGDAASSRAADILSRYSWDRTAQLTLDTYRDVLGGDLGSRDLMGSSMCSRTGA